MAAAMVLFTVPVVEATPAAAATWAVSLSASATDVDAGSSVTLTATVNQTLTGTGFYLDVFDQTTGTPIDFCTTGTSCQVPYSASQAESHTFVAYVDGDPYFEYPPCCVQAVSNTVTVRWHARATAAFNVEFDVNGTLPTFPCDAGCNAPFSGSGTGSGDAHAESGGAEYEAAFAVSGGWVTGYADYVEPRQPVCPGVGSAQGTVTLSGPATGVVHRTSTPTAVGSVYAVTFTLQYTYERAATGSAIVISGGSARIYFALPGTGSDYFDAGVTGGGPGVFDVDPVVAESRCAAPGPVAFRVVGDAVLVLA